MVMQCDVINLSEKQKHTIIVHYCDINLCSIAPIDGVQWVIHSESDTECLIILHSVVISDGDIETNNTSI